jgi:hypothetical protein
MNYRWFTLGEEDRAIYDEIKAFLQSRLTNRETLVWALKTDKKLEIKRLVIRDMFEKSFRDRNILPSPWQSAWELVIESWILAEGDRLKHSEAIDFQNRLRRGERSLFLIDAIVDHFGTKLEVRERGAFGESKGLKKPRTVNDLLSFNLIGGKVAELQYIPINEIDDLTFLITLAHSLQESIQNGFDIVRRIGWYENPGYWFNSGIKSIAFQGKDDPDKFSRGLASSVKLLHATVNRIGTFDQRQATDFLRRWRSESDSLSVRLWASFANRWQWIEPESVGSFLLELDDHQFWEKHYFPEIAELRANRFAQLNRSAQEELWARIRRLPPKTQWSQRFSSSEIREFRFRVAFIETKRIEQEHTILPKSQIKWMENAINIYPELVNTGIVPSPYQEGMKSHWVAPSPDTNLDTLKGSNRLSAIENGLIKNELINSTMDWIRQNRNILLLIDDFIEVHEPIWVYQKTWEQFCYQHKPTDKLYGESTIHDKKHDYEIILAFLQKTPLEKIQIGIRAFSEWLGAWEEYFHPDADSVRLWFYLVDIAEVATMEESREELSVPVRLTQEKKLDDNNLYARNHYSPIGLLVGIFISVFLKVESVQNLFTNGSFLWQMRTRLMLFEGPPKAIVLCQIAEQLPYFLRADELWTLEMIIEPLKGADKSGIEMWEALSHETLFKDSLQFIGDSILSPCSNPALSRQSRQNLVLSVIVECLNAYLEENREPFIKKPLVTHMLYSLDEESRARAVEVLTQYIKNVSNNLNEGNNTKTPETLFETVIKPFIKEIWPKERSLVTPMIAEAFADLPATSRGCFADAVDVIERYIMPFDCYSMFSFGLYDSDLEMDILNTIIASPESAEALLRLLDGSIAYVDRPKFPIELGETLSHIKSIKSNLGNDPRFLRLSMLL